MRQDSSENGGKALSVGRTPSWDLCPSLPVSTGSGKAFCWSVRALQLYPSCCPSPEPEPTPPHPAPAGLGHTGETQQPKAWNWHLDPELWARSVQQQLNTCLRFILEERNVPSSPDKPSFEVLESRLTECGCSIQGHSWDCRKKQKLLKEVVESEQRTSLELLLSELQSLLSAVLQDCSCEAWRYLHAVLGLLPPYREMLTGQLEWSSCTAGHLRSNPNSTWIC